MRVVRSADELSEQIELAQSESKKAFGKDEVFIEKYSRNNIMNDMLNSIVACHNIKD